MSTRGVKPHTGATSSRTTESWRTKAAASRFPDSPRGSVHFLQRYLGNSALRFLMEGRLAESERHTGIENEKRERKFATGLRRDVDEREAERSADQVMGTAAAPTAAGTPGGRPSPAPRLPVHVSAFGASGQPLAEDKRAFFESRFDHDFSHVRLYADTRAAEAARAARAQAFTVGDRIVFGKGQYAPETKRGQRLLSHELAHVVQQRASGRLRLQLLPSEDGPQPSVESPTDPLMKDIEEWVKIHQPPGASLDPKSEIFALTLRNYVYGVTHAGEELIGKPKDKAAAEAWAKRFQDAHRIALMILEAPGGEEREGWAGQIAQDLATAGFVREAFDLAERLPATKKKFVWENVLNHPEAIAPDQLAQISEGLASAYPTVPENPVLRRLTESHGKFAEVLGGEKLVAVLGPTLVQYKGSSAYLEALAQILVFYPAGRVAVSEWLWNSDKDYLYEILNSPHFEDPDYGGVSFPSPSGPRELTLEGDMPWVYTYKQKYYVNYLVGLGAKHSMKIPAPSDMRVATVRDWLDAHTETIGRALAAEFPEKPESITQAFERIADIFFFHIDPPDTLKLKSPSGRLSGLPAGTPPMRIKAECDVFSSYCMRLLTTAQFEPISYLGIAPTNDAAHLVALLRKADRYYVVDNKVIKPINAATEEEALKVLVDEAFRNYDEFKPGSIYRVYFDKAEPDGAMSQPFFRDIVSYEEDPQNPRTQDTRRSDWER